MSITPFGEVGALYGVELELESHGLYEVEDICDDEGDVVEHGVPDIPRGWRVEPEDSIIGVECVFDVPLSYTDGLAAINRLFADIEKKGYRLDRTPRGSTHVHVNCSDLSWEQLEHFVYASAWAEPFLIEIAGKGRRGNLFAVAYDHSPVGWAPIIECIQNQSLRFRLDTHYMAVNFQALAKWGSVEFRMGPSMRNAKEAIDWFTHIVTVAEEGRETPVMPHEAPKFIEYFREYVDPKKFQRLYSRASQNVLDIHDQLVYIKREIPQKKDGLVSAMENLAPYTTSSQDLIAALEELAWAGLPGPPAPASETIYVPAAPPPSILDGDF